MSTEPESLASTVDFLSDGASTFGRMLEAIHQARVSIRLEMYMFCYDLVGRQFIEAMSAATQRGVRVTVILDGIGSSEHLRYVVPALRAGGCKVRVFNPMRFFFFGRLRRNHRKLLLVDKHIAIMGGLNIDARFVEDTTPGHLEKPWVDVAASVEGPLCEELSVGSIRRWRSARDDHTHILLPGIGSSFRLTRVYARAIAEAKQDVVLAQAYFLPDPGIVRALLKARARGIAVRLILPAISDVGLIPSATRLWYRQLLDRGIQIGEWNSSILHAKAACVDGSRLLVGSFNLDPISLVNLESLLNTTHPLAVGKAKAWFEDLWQRATPIDVGTARHFYERIWLTMGGAMLLFTARLWKKLVG